MKFQRENLSDELISEITPLLISHYDEIAKYKDIPLAPDFSKYSQFEQTGMLRIFTARDESGKIHGYAVFIVNWNAHYSKSLQAVQDILFIEKSSRGARVGIGLVQFSDQQLKDEGVQVCYQHVKLEHPALGRLLQTQGYEPIETIFGKRLD